MSCDEIKYVWTPGCVDDVLFASPQHANLAEKYGSVLEYGNEWQYARIYAVSACRRTSSWRMKSVEVLMSNIDNRRGFVGIKLPPESNLNNEWKLIYLSRS